MPLIGHGAADPDANQGPDGGPIIELPSDRDEDDDEPYRERPKKNNSEQVWPASARQVNDEVEVEKNHRSMKTKCDSHEHENVKLAETKKGCGCCSLCLLILKCFGLLCYVCCPPIPECITRKLAFHPPRRGASYHLTGLDAECQPVQTDNAKVAARLKEAKIAPVKLVVGRSIYIDDIRTFILTTDKGCHITMLRVPSRNHHTDYETRDLVVLFSQPNGSDLGCYMQPRGLNLRYLADLLNVDIYAYDYSGYGASTGCPSEKNIYSDISAAYKHIQRERGSKIRIVLIGYSIGTAPTVYLASLRPANLCGIVLVAPFATGCKLFFRREPTGKSCCMDRFRSYDLAPEIEVPALICHGGLDESIPLSHSQALNSQIKRSLNPYFIRNADHMTIFSGKYLSIFFRIRYFLRYETDRLESHTNLSDH